MKFILKKPEDPTFIKGSEGVKFIEWKTGRGDSIHDEITVGRSLIMSPYNNFHTWLTTPITEILSQTPTEIEFRTENSHYILTENE
jgi:hypothetical protein